MAGNVELIKIINRLGHGVSYTKLAGVDTGYAIQKIAINSGLIPDLNKNNHINKDQWSMTTLIV